MGDVLYPWKSFEIVSAMNRRAYCVLSSTTSVCLDSDFALNAQQDTTIGDLTLHVVPVAQRMLARGQHER